jgi:hypothetical protein
VSDTEAPATPRPPDIGRRTLTPFGYAVCFVVPILIAALGFTYLHFHYDKEQLVDGTRLPILTSDWKPGEGAMTAEVTGELVLDDGCLRFETADQGQLDVAWPADYVATVQHVGTADQVKVYNPDRDIVARSSQGLALGGGFTTDRAAYTDGACAPASGQVFLVQSEPRVVDASVP